MGRILRGRVRCAGDSALRASRAGRPRGGNRHRGRRARRALRRVRSGARRLHRPRPSRGRSGGDNAAAAAARGGAARARSDARRASTRPRHRAPAAARRAARRETSTRTRERTGSRGSTTNRMPTRPCAATSCATRSHLVSAPSSRATPRRSPAPRSCRRRPRNCWTSSPPPMHATSSPTIRISSSATRSTGRRSRRLRFARRTARATFCAGFCVVTGCAPLRLRGSTRCSGSSRALRSTRASA